MFRLSKDAVKQIKSIVECLHFTVINLPASRGYLLQTEMKIQESKSKNIRVYKKILNEFKLLKS